MTKQEKTALGRMIFYVQSIANETYCIVAHDCTRWVFEPHVAKTGYIPHASPVQHWASYVVELRQMGVQIGSRRKHQGNQFQVIHTFYVLQSVAAFSVGTGRGAA